MRQFIKDLLYNQDNKNLDIARLCSLIANLAYWGMIGYHIQKGHPLNPLEVGGGWAAIAGGAAAWIYARQVQEKAADA